MRMAEALDLSGREVGRYHVLSLLGSGGMGTVYEAVDVPLGRRVALKMLPPELVADATRVRRFAQEARTASALNHPHVVTVYDIGAQEIDGREMQFIAMERVDGTTLRDALANGPLPLERAIELMQQIADAVASAHEAGVIHRDLKPENIMVSVAGYAKVLDFGLAKLQETTPPSDEAATAEMLSTQSGILLGTPGYMAPEQAQGRPADHRADIFSLGCILYELVAGRRAFRGKSPVDTLHQIVHDEPEPMSGAPAELQRIVRKALVKDPNERYQSARELAIDLRELRRQVDDRRPRLSSQARRLSSIAILALAVVIAAVLIFVATRPREPAAPPIPQLRRLTSSGDVVAAAISPDGKFLAYVVSNDAGQSLWLRQLATQQDLQLVAPARVGFWGHAFTPDGNAIVYGVKSRALPGGAFFRISTLGGTPEHLLDGIDSAPSFSPDGRQMTYVRADYPRTGESSLMIAGIDGAGARALATRRFPEVFAPIFFAGPAWSPDGSTIVATIDGAKLAKGAAIVAFDVKSGAARQLTDRRWYMLGQAAWLPDMRGIVITGSRDADPAPQQRVWLVPYPTGTPRRLTNDLLAYRMPTLSADGKSLVAIGSDVATEVWHVPLAPGARPTKISTGRVDGWRGVACLPDGRIAFAVADDLHFEIVVANADGTQRTMLTRSRYGALYPAASRNGVAYLDLGWDEHEVRITGFERGPQRTAARDVDFGPISISPDGTSVLYFVNRRLWKARNDGSGAMQMLPNVVSSAWFSPDGTRIALFYETAGALRVGIMPAAGGAITWSMPVDFRNVNGGVRWAPDGKALLITDYGPDRANLWRVPFEGTPQKLTSLEGDSAYSFDIAPDGKSAAVARGRMTRDAILITGFR
jgi:serine/threonine protein kinase/Tol biopolymer transport system component